MCVTINCVFRVVLCVQLKWTKRVYLNLCYAIRKLLYFRQVCFYVICEVGTEDQCYDLLRDIFGI
jgi:hypothetical protein